MIDTTSDEKLNHCHGWFCFIIMEFGFVYKFAHKYFLMIDSTPDDATPHKGRPAPRLWGRKLYFALVGDNCDCYHHYCDQDKDLKRMMVMVMKSLQMMLTIDDDDFRTVQSLKRRFLWSIQIQATINRITAKSIKKICWQAVTVLS